MINSVTSTPVQQNDNRRKLHKNLVSATGYTAAGLGTICGVTGLKSVKFSNKMKIHKYSAWLAAVATALHIGIAEGLDKFFYKKS